MEIVPLGGEPQELCPVKTLAKYVKGTKTTTGQLFLNSKTGKPIHKSTVVKLICDVIEEADPGKLPQVHDVRRVTTSLAWTRGLEPSEIARRAFWRSSNIFIERYLSSQTALNCVALNTVQGQKMVSSC